MVASAASKMQPIGDSPSVNNNMSTVEKQEVCRHWAKGFCAFGADCAFPHAGPSPAPAGGGSVVVNGMSSDLIPSADELREKDLFAVVKSSVPCKDYQVAKCHRGDKCKFAHIGGPPRRSAACRDWRQGRCNRGDACRYYHSGPRKEDEQSMMEPVVHTNTTTSANASAPTVVHRIVRYCSAAPMPQPPPPSTVYTSAPQPMCSTGLYAAPQTVVCDPTTPSTQYSVLPSPPQSLMPPPPVPQQVPLVCVPAPSPQPQLQAQAPQCAPQQAGAPTTSAIAEADAAVATLRRQAEEMEARAAALRARADAAVQQVPPYCPAPIPAIVVAPSSNGCSTVPSSSVCSRRSSWSPNTTPTTPRRSSGGCHSYSSYSSEGGDADRAPSPPAGPPPPTDVDTGASPQCVMVHDPYAC